MYINREIEKEISPFLSRKEAIAIIGPRQAGKTTFIKYLESNLKIRNKKVKFINFEKRQDLELFQDNIEDFKDLISQYQYVIIDEFQYAEKGGKNLKYLYDTTKVKFIISGSSSLELTFQTGKYMVGRMLNFRLMPFSFREFLSYQDEELHILLKKRIGKKDILDFKIAQGFGSQINKRLSARLEEYAIYGGYPAVVLTRENSEKVKILEGVAEKYLLKDVKSLLNLASDRELMALSRLLALQIGNIIKYKELSGAAGLNYTSLLKHINILESTFIIKLIKPFFTNRRTELTKNPKVYFNDLGFRNYIINDFRPMQTRNDYGAVMENYAFNLLNKLYREQNIKFWRTKSKAEVDFIIEKDQGIFPLEVKYISKRAIGRSFYSFIDKFNPDTGIILTKDYLGEEMIKNTKVSFIPLSYF